MKPSAIAKYLEQCIDLDVPLFLHGPPGIGKSAVVRQVAEQQCMSLIDVRAVLLDPVDLRGIPHINGDEMAHWCPPAWLPRGEETSGILFLDELPNAPMLVQSALLQLVLDRKLGEYKLPKRWIPVSAGNRVEDRAGSSRLISSLSNRFCHADMEADLDDWIAWAYDHDIHPSVISYLRFQSADLLSFDPSKGEPGFPSPRTWEYTSKFCSVATEDTELDLFSGVIGKGTAVKFVAHRRTYHTINLDDILADPDGYEIPGKGKQPEPSLCWAIVSGLVGRAKGADARLITKVVKFFARLPRLYEVAGMKDLTHVNFGGCQKSKEWDAWSDKKGNKDLLIGTV